MRVDGLYVSGTGVELPVPMAAEAARDAGLCDDWTVRRTRIRSVCVSEEPGPELAVRAARRALAAAGAGPDRIDLVLHADTYHQGHDLWAPASYVQRGAVGNACLAVEVRQLSNGGMAALELGAAYLLADPARDSVLITTGDRFCLPGFDRWRTDPGTVCGDGGTALVLSARGGFARLLSLVTVSAPELESMGRGDDPFGDAPLTARAPISIEAHRAHLLREFGAGAVLERLQAGQREAYERALKEAGLAAADVDRFVLPNLGRPKMDFQFFEPLGIDPERTTWPWGSGVGHLGAGDQIAGLDRLASTGALSVGQTCVLISAGASFAWSVAVLQIVGDPAGAPFPYRPSPRGV
ncbi:ketoacyl-ACP synthase III family protein [Kitasatospora griseola]|uniref:ketoacyl-ACP synthase III family protein n=1 Tax=Kitasatospora griseola TaxID=2064 RepID=UPI000A9AA877|nr:ketoacyl-ACP synthase III family protein [Kitasatospora griseola]